MTRRNEPNELDKPNIQKKLDKPDKLYKLYKLDKPDKPLNVRRKG